MTDTSPARSPTFCIAPWTHLHVVPKGKVFPCCMSAHDPANAIGDLAAGDTLATAWNSPSMRRLRQRMLAGEASRLCERCFTMESVGQQSWRQAETQNMAAHLPVVEQTLADGTLPTMNLPYLDIRPTNVCNLKCRICSPELSSAWHSDAVKLGHARRDTRALVTATPDEATLSDQVLPLLGKVERVHFGGGEPLITDYHYQVLDALLAAGRSHVRLSYNTNLSRLSHRGRDILALWKRFEHVYVQASLDGMGARGEYIRSGQSWSDVEANRRRMLQEAPHVDFSVLATVGIMNVLHIPDFFRDWTDRGFIRPDQMQLNILLEPRYYNIRGLPRRLKARVTDRYGSVIDELSSLGEPGKRARVEFEAVTRYMQGEDWNVSRAFRRRTQRLDALRHESFREVFPELESLMKGWWPFRWPLGGP